MVICKYFQNSNIGYCRYGSNCVNEHLDIKKYIESEIGYTVKSSQWVLSCFGPWSLKLCIPNFIEDQSFEEIRYLWYEAKKDNRLPQFQQQFNLQVLEAKYKLVQLTFINSEVLKMLTKIYDNEIETNKQISAASNNFSSMKVNMTKNSDLFGSNQIQINPFLKSDSTRFVFNTTTANSSFFGSEITTPNLGKIFQNNTETQSAIFGSELIIQKQPQNPFCDSSITQSHSGIILTKQQKSSMIRKNSPKQKLASPNKLFGFLSALPNPHQQTDTPPKAFFQPETTIQNTFDWNSHSKPFAATELKNNIDRLEKLIERLERLVPEHKLKIAKLNSVFETTEQLQKQCSIENSLNKNKEDGNKNILNLNNNFVKPCKKGDSYREGKYTSISGRDIQTLFPPPVLNMSSISLTDNRSSLSTKIKCNEDITNGIKSITFEAPTSTIIDASFSQSPKFNRDGQKWIIEHQKSNSNLLIDNDEMNNIINMFKCENSTLTVKGKVNSVFMDSCKKCFLFVDSVVASIEFVNCQNVQMQILQKCPTISIKKTDGCQMYLTKNSLDVEILSSKSSKMNAMIPKDNGDYIGQLIPEQYKTLIKGTSLQTTCIESEYFLN